MSGHGGQGAQAFTQGFNSGMQSVDNLKNSAQTREMRAKEASQKAKLFEHQLTQAENATENSNIQSGALKRLDEKQKEVDVKLKKIQGKEFNTGLNGFMASPDKSEYLTTFSNTYADTISAMGVDPKSLRMPTKDDTKLIMTALTSEGADFNGYENEDINEVVDQAVESGRYIISNGQVINTQSLAVTTGAGKLGTPAEKKAIEASNKALETNIKSIQKKVDDKLIVNKAKRDEEIKLLKEQAIKGDTQLAGLSQLPDSSKEPATISTMLNDWIKDNPDAKDEEILAHSMALRGKSGGGDSDSVYKQKVNDAVKHKGMTMAEAITYVNEGTQGAVMDKKSAATTNAVSAGYGVKNSENADGTYTVSNNAKAAESAFSNTPAYDKKSVREFRDYSSVTKEALTASTDVINKIDKGEINFDVAESGLHALATKTPNFLRNTLSEFSDGSINEKDLTTKIGVKGELALVIGKMVKSIYGGNASNSDREAFEKAFSVGTWDNTEAVKAKMQSMHKIVERSYRNKGDSMMVAGYGASTANQMNEVFSKPKDKKETKPSGNVTKTVTQGGKTYKVVYDASGKYLSSEEI